MQDQIKNIDFMKVAIKEAKKAYKIKEIPVGAVIVQNNKIISTGFNKRETNQNVLYHAEIIAINNACKKLKSWRILNSEIYVTLEPCLMCAGAIINAKIEKVIYGVKNNYYDLECIKFLKEIYKKNNIKIISGICEKESKNLLQSFFKKMR